jgi:rRNA maturation protein Nop10
MLMHKCQKCNVYTLKETCPVDWQSTNPAHPARFRHSVIVR